MGGHSPAHSTLTHSSHPLKLLLHRTSVLVNLSGVIYRQLWLFTALYPDRLTISSIVQT